MALWVEKHHPDRGPAYIAEKVDRLTAAGEGEGAALWRQVAERYGSLAAGPCGSRQ